MRQAFAADSNVTAELLLWLAGLEHDRGARAELRRCHSVLHVMQTPAFQAIRQRLVLAGLSELDSRRDRLATVIALLAHLRAGGALEPADAFSEGERPPVSPMRFRQVLEARDDDELFLRLRRVLPLVNQRISPARLARDVFDWDDGVRKRWIYAYRWPQKKQSA